MALTDTLVVSGPTFQQLSADQLVVTPTGWTQKALQDALAYQSVSNALTAIGTNRATSLALVAQVNNITTALSGTGVTLPTAVAGMVVIVFNAGANAIKVYGAGSDTIDGAAAATGVTLTNALRAQFYAVASATWVSAQLGVVSA